MNDWKRNPSAARIHYHLANVNTISRVPWQANLSRQRVRATLRHLADHRAPLSQYVEFEIPGPNGVQNVGCLLLGHTRTTGEPGYYAAILTEDAFPSCGYISIAPCRDLKKSFISELHVDGWRDLTMTEAGKRDAARIALLALDEVPDSKGRIRMSSDQIVISSEFDPPHDFECTRRIKLVMRHRMPLAKAMVRRLHVRPFDEEFTATLPKERIKWMAGLLANAPRELLVYWNGKQFVSSDDHLAYRGYESLSVEYLPVVIMGDFPSELTRIEQRGGYELMPPVLIVREKAIEGVNEQFLVWQEEEKQLQTKRLPPPADLIVSWIIFAEMLAEEDIDERALHNFLDENPVMMGAHWDTVHSEVSFGGQYRADFVLRADRALPTVRLVELEKSSHRLFTKGLQETAEVTHAVQQVNDWLRWWRENSEHPLVAPSRGVNPDGLVVIGRSIHMSEDERQALAHNNQGRDIQVITYDELLDDFGTLILHRLDDTRS